MRRFCSPILENECGGGGGGQMNAFTKGENIIDFIKAQRITSICYMHMVDSLRQINACFIGSHVQTAVIEDQGRQGNMM